MMRVSLCTMVLVISFATYDFIDKSKKSPRLEPSEAVVNQIQHNNSVTLEENLLPFTGENAEGQSLSNIPFMAIIENSRDARPQSGLLQADIVFETMAEGGIPRFIALFHKNNPKEIGPIRSARPYFIDLAKEYDMPFAHCGGSGEALNSIKSEKLKSLDEMANGKSYWRDSKRKAPHNLYTSAENIRNLISNKGYEKDNNIKLKFDKAYWEQQELKGAKNISLKLNKFYSTTYEYKDGNYIKYMDGKVAEDKALAQPIKVKNIVIQKTSISLSEDGLHVNIPLVGEGEGMLISNGKCVDIKWYKKDITSQTKFMDSTGKDLGLNPGNTWWNIIDKNNEVNIE